MLLKLKLSVLNICVIVHFVLKVIQSDISVNEKKKMKDFTKKNWTAKKYVLWILKERRWDSVNDRLITARTIYEPHSFSAYGGNKS